jgi:hypothetical protein
MSFLDPLRPACPLNRGNFSLTATTVFGLVLGYSTGSLIDRLKPVRVIPVTFFIYAVLSLILKT